MLKNNIINIQIEVVTIYFYYSCCSILNDIQLIIMHLTYKLFIYDNNYNIFFIIEVILMSFINSFQRGRFYPQLSYLIKVNTPRAVMQETKKAFRKLPNIESAMTALSNLKGVGTATASALLAAASPEIAPFMADECIQAIPEMEGSDYTAKEYLNFVKHIRNVCDRLNKVSA